jgi:hypothetical protein
MILNKKEIEKIRLRTQMNEMKHIVLTSPYASVKESAQNSLDSLQETYKSLFEEYSAEHLIVNESRGGALTGMFDDLVEFTKSLQGGSKDITDAEIEGLTGDVEALRGKFAKVLKGKGIVGW